MSGSLFQQRILELCAKVVASEDPDEFRDLASELRDALAEQIIHLRLVVEQAKAQADEVSSDQAAR